jgi:hypothetical protein
MADFFIYWGSHLQAEKRSFGVTVQRTGVPIAVALFVVGCTSYHFVEVLDKPDTMIAAGGEAFVMNPALDLELDILRRSGLYDLTDDSSATMKIELKPLEVAGACGNPLLGTVPTLGLLPGVVYDQYRFSYSEETVSGVRERNVLIVVQMRVWAFEFLFSGNRKDEIARGLRVAFNRQ